MTTKRVFETDSDRINGVIDRCPSYKFGPSVADAFKRTASNKTLRHVCNTVFPSNTCIGKADYVERLHGMSSSRLAKVCKDVDIDPNARDRKELIALLKERPDTDPGPICFENFEAGDQTVVLLLTHDFHHD